LELSILKILRKDLEEIQKQKKNLLSQKDQNYFLNPQIKLEALLINIIVLVGMAGFEPTTTTPPV
jgi:hypothetical protein